MSQQIWAERGGLPLVWSPSLLYSHTCVISIETPHYSAVCVIITSKVCRNLIIASQGRSEVRIASDRSSDISHAIISFYKIAVI